MSRRLRAIRSGRVALAVPLAVPGRAEGQAVIAAAASGS
jgi:hypothetical protein